MTIKKPPRDFTRLAAARSFSERFAELLDRAGFVQGRGRLTEVSHFFEVGKSNAHNWLTANICPRAPTLDLIVSKLHAKGRLPKTLDKVAVVLWLEKGDPAVPNPIQGTKTISHQSHFYKSRIYLAVGEEARNLNMDLFALDKSTVDQIFTEIFALPSKNKTTLIPDRIAIRRILRASLKLSEEV